AEAELGPRRERAHPFHLGLVAEVGQESPSFILLGDGDAGAAVSGEAVLSEVLRELATDPAAAHGGLALQADNVEVVVLAADRAGGANGMGQPVPEVSAGVHRLAAFSPHDQAAQVGVAGSD